MFSLKATKLNFSRVSLLLWVVLALSVMALLQLYWMPLTWRLMLYACISFCVALVSAWMVYRPAIEVGVDEQGAYFFDGRNFFRLLFVRANGIQLIAKVETDSDSWWHRVMPPYRVIYCDNLPKSSYRRLRSFAAQQILLRRSEDARERFTL